MLKTFLYFLLHTLIFAMTLSNCYAGNTYISIQEQTQNITNNTTVYYDNTQKLTVLEVKGLTFIPVTDNKVNLNNVTGTYWIMFDVYNDYNQFKQRILSIDYAHFNKFVLYELTPHTSIAIANAGINSRKKNNNIISSRFPAIKLDLPAKAKKKYLLRLNLGHYPTEYSLQLYTENSFYEKQLNETYFFAGFSGFLFALFLYNLSLYKGLKTPRFIYYCCGILCYLTIALGYEGYLYLLFSITLQTYSKLVAMVISISGIAMLLLVRSIINIDEISKRLSMYLNYIIIFFVISLPITLFISSNFSLLSELVLYPTMLVTIWLSIISYKKGNKAGLYFTFAQLSIVIAILGDWLIFNTQSPVIPPNLYGLVDANWMKQYFYYSGLLIDLFLMSLTLSVFVKQLNDDKQSAQKSTLVALQESNQLKNTYSQQLEAEIDEAISELNDKNAKLEKLDQQKTLFFTNISHEFRTPLTLIQEPVRKLAAGDYGKLTDKGNQAIEISSRNIARLSRLINELLLLAELDAGVISICASESDIGQFCRRTASLFIHTADEKNITFQCDFPENELFLFFDQDKLEKVVVNLLSNAFKYTPSGGVVTFSIKSVAEEIKDTGNFLTIIVEDSGIGISKNEQSHIFDRFYRAKSTSDNYIEGSGIGLALVNELVELHGGEINFASKTIGTGSAFSVILPLGKEHFSSQELIIKTKLQQKHVIKNTNATRKNKFIVLVVEDNPDMRAFIVQQLDEQFIIIEAEHGAHALDILCKQTVDLVLSDVMMPKMDGITLLETIRNDERYCNLPVILLTAKAADEDKLLALKAKADDFLPKPFNPTELTLKVGNLLERYTQKNQEPVTSDKQAQITKNKINCFENEFLKKVKTCVDTNISSVDFDVNKLAAALFMSRSTLQRKIEQESGLTAAQFVRNIRLAKAHQFIQSKTHRTLSETAYAVGFNHAGYFSKLYKRYCETLTT